MLMFKEKMQVESKDYFQGEHWVLPTDIKLVDEAEAKFGKKLSEAGWQESDDFDWLKTCFREALVNAIVHGNLEIKDKSEDENWQTAALRVQEQNPTPRKVYVNMDIKPESISVTIRDEGKGFKAHEVVDPTSKEGVLKSSGRGFAFMNNFFDEVRHNDIGNEVAMIKNKKSPQ